MVSGLAVVGNAVYRMLGKGVSQQADVRWTLIPLNCPPLESLREAREAKSDVPFTKRVFLSLRVTHATTSLAGKRCRALVREQAGCAPMQSAWNTCEQLNHATPSVPCRCRSPMQMGHSCRSKRELKGLGKSVPLTACIHSQGNTIWYLPVSLGTQCRVG